MPPPDISQQPSSVGSNPFMYNATADGVVLDTPNDYDNPGFDLNVSLLDLQQTGYGDWYYDQFVLAQSMPRRVLCQEYSYTYCTLRYLFHFIYIFRFIFVKHIV
jgi:hypothetical protein